MAGFLARQKGGGDEQEQELFLVLKTAYDRDSSYISFQSYNNHKTSFLRGRQEVIELLNDALIQMPHADGRDIVITASFDLLRLYREDITALIKTLRSAGTQRIRLTAVLSPEALDSDQRFYTDSLLDIIGGLDYIEMSILTGSAGLPEILIINDVFCMQLLWNTGGETAAVFSSDREVVAKQLAAENTHTLIDVFCISPGAIETPMFYSSTLKNMSPEERKAFDAAQAKKRLIQPSEIAFWLGELLRDESTLFHGANIDATMGLGTRPGIQTEAGLEHN